MQANELFDRLNTILLDGGMGTMLQAAGLKLGARPEELNITDPALIESIHARYAAAGSRIINANTFGASAHKLAGSEYTLEEIIAAGIANCKRACAPYGALAALDVGPLGELLEPNGTLAFEDAVAEYGRIVRAGVAAGADLVFLETFTDLYELKAALLAVKENSSLPVLASMSFEAGGRTFTGCTVESFAATARGLGADAVGINCSLGPKEIFPMAKRLTEALPGSFPVFVKPNAGLPRADGSGYDITPQLFAMEMKPYRELNLFAAGGCCGTTPEFIRLLNGVFKGCVPGRPAHAMPSVLCTPMNYVNVDGITVVGERINPTGKKLMKAALREKDINYLIKEGIAQKDKGAHILDVNVGLPEIDEPAMMQQALFALQGVLDLPLQIDTSDVEAMEVGLRHYNGKAMLNSVNGKQESMHAVFPLVKKYGAVVVCLCLDESGIPPTAEGRIAIAKKIIATAAEYGIPKHQLVFDALVMTVSTDKRNAIETLKAVRILRHELGVATTLGVSNISFGLPKREMINTAFFTLALEAGLSAGIMNPLSDAMMNAYYSYNALAGLDDNCQDYIASVTETAAATPAGTTVDLKTAIIKGMRKEAGQCAAGLLEEQDSLQIINEHIIPALDVVGDGFEKNKVFLPQLLMSADAAKSAFDVIKEKLRTTGQQKKSPHKIVLATVHGDIHDIGKNIVKVLLENYGFDVLDLGKDVPEETVLQAVQDNNATLVGLSALMTTTVPAMERTIELVHKNTNAKVIVGGAVLTRSYAEMIHADHYAKDAMETVRLAKAHFGIE